jgi:pimeloyl-ACP methyl ester carboxylesterase
VSNPRHGLFLAGLLALCQAGCLSLENRLLFHPVPSAPGATELPADAPIRNVYLRSADGNQIHVRWFPYPQATGAVVFCPGNAGNLDYRNHQVSELAAELHESVLIFDYPGYGQSQGQPSEKGCCAAADTAYEWLKKSENIAPERIIICGESLGGGVAVDLASRKPHRALVLVRTFTSVPEVGRAHVYLPMRWLVHNRFESVVKIKSCTRPIFIAYADKDRVMPLHHAEQLKAACQAPCELFLLKGLGHNDPPGPDFYAALRAFLETRAPIGTGSSP